jgi:hypothetical protein
VRSINNKLDIAKANAYFEAKNNATGKSTVKDLENMVMLDEKVQKLENELIEAEKIHADMKSATRAFVQRHDALKDLAANVRREWRD